MTYEASPVEVGKMLFVLTDPEPGFEREYNRWYERDHIYAGCMIGPWLFAGRRWVATRSLKALRFPETGPHGLPVQAGSYCCLFWVLKGHEAEQTDWATDQVKRLYAGSRGFDHRVHVHTSSYLHSWRHYRDPDPVPLELALDHDFGGLIVVMTECLDGVDAGQVDDWLRRRFLPGWMSDLPISSCSSWTPYPFRSDAPTFVPRDELADRRTIQLYFTEGRPEEVWDAVRELGDGVARTGLARVALAAPFIPTIVGTDTYTDDLWPEP